MLEEAHEALEALDAGEPQALYEELGDLLLQIMLHTQIATDDGGFRMPDLIRRLNEKMISRHPHVWGDVEATGDLAQLSRIWQAAKAAEKAGGDREGRRCWMGSPRARRLCS